MTGPEDEIKPLLEQLKAEGVFVRELDTRGLAFHSPVLQSHLGELKEGEQQTHVPSYLRRKQCSRGILSCGSSLRLFIAEWSVTRALLLSER